MSAFMIPLLLKNLYIFIVSHSPMTVQKNIGQTTKIVNKCLISRLA